MQYSLLLALLVASVGSDVIDLNGEVDAKLKIANEVIRKIGKSASLYPGWSFSNVTFSESYLVGLDSLTRTGDCLIDVVGKTSKFSLNYGLKMWVQAFRKMIIDGDEMSVVFRIRDNSMHLGFTVYNDTKCYVALDDFQYERLSDVEFSASRPEYDGIDVENFFQTEIRSAINVYVESQKKRIEKALQYICTYTRYENLENFISLQLQILNHEPLLPTEEITAL